MSDATSVGEVSNRDIKTIIHVESNYKFAIYNFENFMKTDLNIGKEFL